MTSLPLTTDVSFTPQYLWRNGELVLQSSATVHVSHVSHASVSSVFEGIKAYWNADDGELFVFRLEEHIERFIESIRMVRLNNRYSAAAIVSGVLELLRANEARADVYIRPWVYASDPVHEVMVPTEMDCDLVIDSWQFSSRMLTERGCRAVISSWMRIDESSWPPRIKAFSNCHTGRLGVMEARQRGADWPIFLNRHGKVAEGPTACIAMIRRGQFVTPPLSSGILDSITRRTVLDLVPAVLDMPVFERDIDRTDLYSADEIFFLGTCWEILPILEIDGMKVGDGSMGLGTRMIDRAYHDAVRGIEFDREWRTGVWGHFSMDPGLSRQPLH